MSHHHHHHGGELATVFACPPCAGAAGLDITGAQTVVDGQGYGWIVHSSCIAGSAGPGWVMWPADPAAPADDPASADEYLCPHMHEHFLADGQADD
jgi:hypothetical protein